MWSKTVPTCSFSSGTLEPSLGAVKDGENSGEIPGASGVSFKGTSTEGEFGKKFARSKIDCVCTDTSLPFHLVLEAASESSELARAPTREVFPSFISSRHSVSSLRGPANMHGESSGTAKIDGGVDSGVFMPCSGDPKLDEDTRYFAEYWAHRSEGDKLGDELLN